MMRPLCLTSSTPVKPQGAASKQAEQVEWMDEQKHGDGNLPCDWLKRLLVVDIRNVMSSHHIITLGNRDGRSRDEVNEETTG